MFLGGYNDCTSINPRSMPLCELPVPQVFREFLEHDTPHGYGFNPRWTAQLNHYNVTFQRSIYVVTDTYEAEDGPELMLRWYACRNTQKRGFELVEIMRQSPAEEWCYYRNAYYRTLAGWQFVYRDEEKKTRGGYYGYNYTLWEKGWFNKWMPEAQKKAPGFTAYWIMFPNCSDCQKASLFCTRYMVIRSPLSKIFSTPNRQQSHLSRTTLSNSSAGSGRGPKRSMSLFL
jgi:hypothetical protein